MQTRYWNWLDDDATKSINSWLLGILRHGVYAGFDFEPSADLTLSLGVGSSGYTFVNDQETEETVSVLLTRQGVVIKEDAAVSLAINPTNTGNRWDLIICEHQYEEIVGGEQATYSVIQGVEDPNIPSKPTAPNPLIQTVVGYLYLPAGTSQLDAEGVLWEKPQIPDTGGKELSFRSEYGGVSLTVKQLVTGTSEVIVDLNTQFVQDKAWTDIVRTGTYVGTLTDAPSGQTVGGHVKVAAELIDASGTPKWSVSYLFQGVGDASLWSRVVVFNWNTSTNAPAAIDTDSEWVAVGLAEDLAKKVPFANLATNTDLNSLTTNGHYWVRLTNVVLNNPARSAGYTAGTNDFYHVIVLGQVGATSYLTQIAIETVTQRMFIRNSNLGGSSWFGWREYKTKLSSSNNTIAIGESRPADIIGSLFDLRINTVILGSALTESNLNPLDSGFYSFGLSNGDTGSIIVLRNQFGGTWQVRLRITNGGLNYSMEYRWSGDGVNFVPWIRVPNDFEVNTLIDNKLNQFSQDQNGGVVRLYGVEQGQTAETELSLTNCLAYWSVIGNMCFMDIWTPNYNPSTDFTASDGVQLPAAQRYLAIRFFGAALPPLPSSTHNRKIMNMGRIFINGITDPFENDEQNEEIYLSIDTDVDRPKFLIFRTPDALQGNSASLTFSDKVGGHLQFHYRIA